MSVQNTFTLKRRKLFLEYRKYVTERFELNKKMRSVQREMNALDSGLVNQDEA
jgi:hypothetical protein